MHSCAQEVPIPKNKNPDGKRCPRSSGRMPSQGDGVKASRPRCCWVVVVWLGGGGKRAGGLALSVSSPCPSAPRAEGAGYRPMRGLDFPRRSGVFPGVWRHPLESHRRHPWHAWGLFSECLKRTCGETRVTDGHVRNQGRAGGSKRDVPSPWPRIVNRWSIGCSQWSSGPDP